MSIITGTSYFVSKEKAIEYYREYHYSSTEWTVDRKLMSGEIHIGQPELKEGESLTLLDDGARYGILSK